MSDKEIDVLEQEAKDLKDQMHKVLEHRKDDYAYTRDVLYMAIEHQMDIVESAKQLAQESEHPRAIEVASNAVSQLTDMAGKLMEHQIKTDRLNNPTGQKQTANTTNNLNVHLKTSDLLELLNKE